MSIDIEQFHQIFFEESLEGLDLMEQALLGLNADDEIDLEVINTIFRAAHSIKGGSATFGFSEIADFTHVLETLLDEVRDGKRRLTEQSIELLLRSSDCLRGMINSLQADEKPDATESAQLIRAFEQILGGAEPVAEVEVSSSVTAQAASSYGNEQQQELSAAFDQMLTEPASADAANADSTECVWTIDFIPQPQVLLTGNEPVRLFRELAALGELSVTANTNNVPEFQHLTPDECFISWQLQLKSEAATEEDILEVFEWVMDECELKIEKSSPENNASQQSRVETEQVASAEPVADSAPDSTAGAVTAPTKSSAKDSNASAPAPSTGASSIRVGIDKVDSLINLVGELVITQSMLSEVGNNFDMDKLDKLTSGLEQLLHNTKEIQESVMRIRMLPISFAFNRFPRMIRDLASKSGKKVDLQILGESTELDKTVMEQITDPLVHLVRNAIDHGIETVEDRLAKGKPEQGTIRLNAYHQGGNIVVEVGDDGKGLNPEIIKNKAIDKGLIDADAQLSDSEIFDLIFLPGFSTASQVSEVSGRGVGMDVVKRNIKSLGGRIQIDSKIDQGSTIKVHLPLTLAILDGQLVRVGKEIYIIPLLAIVESLQIKEKLVNRVSGNMVLYRLREDNVPIIPIYKEFDIPADSTEYDNALLVVVESDGQKVGLLVDDLLAQQQVVIKSLESNYTRIEGISGATILGDGSVSMILDVPGLIARSARRAQRQHQAA